MSTLGEWRRCPLLYALEGRNDECLRLVIEAGTDGHGSIKLHDLVTKGKAGFLLEHRNDLKIEALLRAGAKINNTRDNLLTSCLDSGRKPHRKKQLALLLFAAGEKLTKPINETPGYLRFPQRETLKLLCRESIRKHLLGTNNVNLFYKVAKLGLPTVLSKYLLYEQSVTE